MDRSWINDSNRLISRFIEGVASFMEIANNTVRDGEILCPCQKCVNGIYQTTGIVVAHILENGFCKSYMTWYFHGETVFQSAESPSRGSTTEPERFQQSRDMQQNVQDFIEDMATGYTHLDESEPNTNSQNPQLSGQGVASSNDANRFYDILDAIDKELFQGCKKHSKLSFVLELYHKKCMNGLSNKAFNDILSTLRETLHEGDSLPKSSYEIKKLIRDLGLHYEKIDACENNCMLFWKNNKDEITCLECGLSRYTDNEHGDQLASGNKKKKKISRKVLRWFPLKPRLQRLFICSKIASYMRWHFDERKEDGYVLHPADDRAWKDFDIRYPDFAKDPRNIRLGMATDGFNPFRTLSSTHSTWHVLLTIYNWAPWLCMKQPSFILFILIPGPSSPGDKIDVFLKPLIDELHDLWVHGLPTYDAKEKETFQLHAALMWTINDFPAYGMLSGWRTKTKYACPTCGFNTWSMWLVHGGKYCYMGHQRFLSREHPFRRNKRKFDGREEHREVPAMTYGYDIISYCNGDTIVKDLDGKAEDLAARLKKKVSFLNYLIGSSI
ncbi:hypothetical protein LINPERPRIM_LOCUS31644 [Linum perenne]